MTGLSKLETGNVRAIEGRKIEGLLALSYRVRGCDVGMGMAMGERGGKREGEREGELDNPESGKRSATREVEHTRRRTDLASCGWIVGVVVDVKRGVSRCFRSRASLSASCRRRVRALAKSIVRNRKETSERKLEE